MSGEKRGEGQSSPVEFLHKTDKRKKYEGSFRLLHLRVKHN